MEPPKIATDFLDPETGGKWRVFAYRPITMAEAMPHILGHLRDGNARPKKGMICNLVTFIGANS